MGYLIKDLKRKKDLAERVFISDSSGVVHATKDIQILFPERWVGRDLAWIDGNIRILTKCMLLMGDEYSVMNDCNYWPLSPDNIGLTTIDGEPHYEFIFTAGSVVCPNNNVLIDDDILYSIFSEFVEKGQVPPYFDSTDLSKMFLNSRECTGRILAGSNTIIDMVISSIVRKQGNETIHYRHLDESDKKHPAYVAFRSPVYMANTSLTKISTAFAKDGVTSALVTETLKVRPLERIVRS
jgi:hypothetical protein